MRSRHVTEMTLHIYHPEAVPSWATATTNYYLVVVNHSDGESREYVPSLESVSRVNHVIEMYRYLGGKWVRRDHDVRWHSGEWRAE